MRPIVDRGPLSRRAAGADGEGGGTAPDGRAGGTEPDGRAGGRAPDGEARGASSRWAAWGRAGLVVLLVVVADQLSKRAVRHSIVPGEERKLLPGVQLVNTRNHGVAFGFLPDSGAGLTILIALALGGLLVYFARNWSKPWIWLPTGLLVGGALGNVLDRVRQGAVTDFVKLPLGWPPFNLADTAIVLGIVILFVLVDRSRQTRR